MQRDMVARIGQALQGRPGTADEDGTASLPQHLLVEAGTGAGKSFGYLLPLILEAPKPVVVSTGTIALQEQLLLRDLPFLLAATGREDMKIALAKGRGNYLCIQKLVEMGSQLVGNDARIHPWLGQLSEALDEGWTGDVAALEFAPPDDLWHELQASADDCLGRRCQFFSRNPFQKAREQLAQADIIVTNHALYLHDRMGPQAVFPSHAWVVFDEAHRLGPYALNAQTQRIPKHATVQLVQRISRRLAPVPDTLTLACYDVEAALMRWLFAQRSLASEARATFRLHPDATWFALIERQLETLGAMQQWLAAMALPGSGQPQQTRLDLPGQALDENTAEGLRLKLGEALQTLIDRWAFFGSAHAMAYPTRVNWVEIHPERLLYELRSTPLDIDQRLKTTLWSQQQAVLTSATLATPSMAAFQQSLGLATDAPAVQLPSPFDYTRQCCLYLPTGMPEPNDPTWLIAVAHQAEALLRLSQGRAFVLCSSYYIMRQLGAALRERLPYPAKLQGERSKKALLAWFQETPNSVLFATASFWEGIDVPGEALSLVILDKIPFAAPDDPLQQATVDYLKQQGRDWFTEHTLPQAILRLKQGFGRLIRRRSDTGIVALLDPRVRGKGYGKRVLKSLPTCPTFATLPDVTDWWLRQQAACFPGPIPLEA
jgi:ATP-dependent DNA helicase DinG